MESQIPVKLAGMLEKLETATRAIQSQIEFTRVYQNLGTHEPQWQNINRAIPLELVPDTVRVTTDLPAVEVYADPMLKKVFTNLLDNSLRHGGKVTTVKVLGINPRKASLYSGRMTGSVLRQEKGKDLRIFGMAKTPGLVFSSRGRFSPSPVLPSGKREYRERAHDSRLPFHRGNTGSPMSCRARNPDTMA